LKDLRKHANTLKKLIEAERDKEIKFEDGDPNKLNPYLNGNFAPVEDETAVEGLEVQGKVPEELQGGIYVRDGGNPHFAPIGHYIWIDSDGMLHKVRLGETGSKDKKLRTTTYMNKFIETDGWLIEKQRGKAIWPEITSIVNFRFLLNLVELWIEYILKINPYKPPFIKITGNTNVILTAGQVLALYEFGNATLVDASNLSTLNREYDFNGQWKCHFTAHPKVDPETKEFLGFGYNFPFFPEIQYSVWSPEGQLKHSAIFKLPKASGLHDWWVTKNYSIWMDGALTYEFDKIFDIPVRYDYDKQCRIGVCKRYGTGIKWFNVPNQFFFHTFNAYEKQDETTGRVKLIMHACKWKYLTLTPSPKDKQPFPTVWEYTLDPETGDYTERQVSSLYVDFPRINENCMGLPYRYGYAAEFYEPNEDIGLWRFNTIIKFDFNAPNGNPQRYSVGDKRFAGEPCFVARKNAKSEDDGFLVTFVYDENKKRSELVILDAKTFSGPPIATVPLPVRVPYGLHGNFFTKEQLATLKK
jgi:carotenoid cleavage dioxygenase-like enzyme